MCPLPEHASFHLFARLQALKSRFASTLWLIPVISTCTAAALAAVIAGIDRGLTTGGLGRHWLITTNEAGRTILSVVAGSMMTIVGVVFSVTIVTYSIAASQFGSRVLRSRTEDYVTHITFACFLGTSVYSLVALGATGSVAEEESAPHLTVFTAIVLAVASLIVLIYFIRHVATVIQATELIAQISRDLRASIDRMFPEDSEPAKEQQDATAPQELQTDHYETICLSRDGYIQTIEVGNILEACRESDAVLELIKRPGDYATPADSFARVYSRTKGKSLEELTRAVRSAVTLGNHRTPVQDVNCSIHELAQVAVRSLSPGINDPYTAMNCIDSLSSGLAVLAGRRSPSAVRHDQEGVPRLIAYPVSLEQALSAAFDQIEHYAHDNAPVRQRLIHGFARIAADCASRGSLDALKDHAQLFEKTVDSEGRRAVLEDRVERSLGHLYEVLDDRDQDLCRSTATAQNGGEGGGESPPADAERESQPGEVSG
jgi:uncharacterized membrane protein